MAEYTVAMRGVIAGNLSDQWWQEKREDDEKNGDAQLLRDAQPLQPQGDIARARRAVRDDNRGSWTAIAIS